MLSHFWTVYPRARHHLAPRPSLSGEPWRGVVEDPDRGRVELRGRLRRPPASDTVVVLIHGLGGGIDSPYLAGAAAECDAAGLATLRLGLRGSDGTGGDFYHAGLTADVAAALASPELAGFARVALLGFSLGGHVALRYACDQPDCEEPDPRLRAVAAVCTPLDLGEAQRSFDRLRTWPYRVYVLGRLMPSFEALARQGALPTPLDRLRRIRTLRELDRLTVVPRFRFADPEDYYRRASVGPLLPGLRVGSLLVASPGDPMVPAASIRAAARGAPRLDVRWARGGGHVGFPSWIDLGEAAPRGLDTQLAAWLSRQ